MLVFCVVFGFLYIFFGEEQALKSELKKISDDNDRRAAEAIRKQNEELERIRKGKEEIKKIFEDPDNFEGKPYKIQCKVMKTKEYGIPQNRERTIIIGSMIEFDLDEEINKTKEYIKKTNRRLTFEYILLDGINDTESCAIALVHLIAGMNAYVNLIPYNSVKENEFKRSEKVKEFAKQDNAGVVVLCAKIEEDLASIDDDEERAMFAEELGLSECGLDILVTECYSLLGLISYLTAGEKETRAWTIEKGTKAPQAAGKIHSDFERGFIRAEIVDYKILLELGSYTIAKEKGKVRSEGKDYVVQDGDVVLFRFNV